MSCRALSSSVLCRQKAAACRLLLVKVQCLVGSWQLLAPCSIPRFHFPFDSCETLRYILFIDAFLAESIYHRERPASKREKESAWKREIQRGTFRNFGQLLANQFQFRHLIKNAWQLPQSIVLLIPLSLSLLHLPARIHQLIIN